MSYLKLKSLDHIAWSTGYSQIFIETPYRNASLYQALIQGGKVRYHALYLYRSYRTCRRDLCYEHIRLEKNERH